MQLSVGQCPDGSPAHCTLVACYWVRLLIWDWGLCSCLLGHCYRAFTSPSKLLLSIQHSKPKAGNGLSEVKLYELSTVTAVGLSCSRRCLFVHVCACVRLRNSQIQVQERTPAPHPAVSLLSLYESSNRRKKAVSELPVIPATASYFSVHCLLLFLVSLLLHLQPSLLVLLLLCLILLPNCWQGYGTEPDFIPQVVTEWLTM